jgi:hypothetical protein
MGACARVRAYELTKRFWMFRNIAPKIYFVVKTIAVDTLTLRVESVHEKIYSVFVYETPC